MPRQVKNLSGPKEIGDDTFNVSYSS